jgi:hypothetical protein
MELRRVSESDYHGRDPVSGHSVDAQPGQVVDVPDAFGERLLADFPTEWELAGARATETVASNSSNEAAPVPDQPHASAEPDKDQAPVPGAAANPPQPDIESDTGGGHASDGLATGMVGGS